MPKFDSVTPNPLEYADEIMVRQWVTCFPPNRTLTGNSPASADYTMLIHAQQNLIKYLAPDVIEIPERGEKLTIDAQEEPLNHSYLSTPSGVALIKSCANVGLL